MIMIIGFVIILMLLLIVYMFYRMHITRKFAMLILITLQICVFTTALLAFLWNVGTSDLVEGIYILIGVLMPGSFLVYDYCHMALLLREKGVPEVVKRQGVADTQSAYASVDVGDNPVETALDNPVANIPPDNMKEAEDKGIIKDGTDENINYKKEERDGQVWNQYLDAGVALYEQGRFIEALEMYAKALGAKPDEFVIYYHIGSALIELRKFDEALSCFKKALTVKLTDSELYYDIATVYSLLKKYDIAVDALRNAIRLNGRLKTEARYNQAFENIKKMPEFRKLVYQ